MVYIYIYIFKVIYDTLNDMTSLSNYINIISAMKSAQDVFQINLNLYLYQVHVGVQVALLNVSNYTKRLFLFWVYLLYFLPVCLDAYFHHNSKN